MRPLPSLGVRRARREARAVLQRFRLRDAADLDVAAIANMLRVEVTRGDLHGATARLARVGRFGTIRLSTRNAHPGAERFSIAHELGHFLLKHPTPDPAALCDARTVHGYASDGAEHEANAFAAELLMPEPMTRRRCEVSPVSLDPARELARDFGVSLMAAALRFVELTSERCALVFARDRRIAWAARSDTFAPFIERGRALDAASVAIDWYARGAVSDGCQPGPADAWLDHEAATGAEIWEECVPVPEQRGTLSLLWIPERAAAPFDRA